MSEVSLLCAARGHGWRGHGTWEGLCILGCNPHLGTVIPGQGGGQEATETTALREMGGQARKEVMEWGHEYLPSPGMLQPGTLLEKGRCSQPGAKAKAQDLSQGPTLPLSIV